MKVIWARLHSPLRLVLLLAATILILLVSYQLRSPSPVARVSGSDKVVNQGTLLPSEEFPEPTDSLIGLSLTDICTAADNDRDSFFDSRDFENSPEQIEQYKGMLRIVKDRLVVSPTSEHLHLAALLEREPVVRIELIKKALSQNPDDAYLLWDAVHICAAELDKTECPIREWEQRLLAIDSQNSESWILVAANRYHAGEVDAALRQCAEPQPLQNRALTGRSLSR